MIAPLQAVQNQPMPNLATILGTPLNTAAKQPQTCAAERLWSQISREATEVCQREPQLETWLWDTVLSHPSLSQALRKLLAQKLKSADFSETE